MNPHTPVAPSNNELHKLVSDLKEKVERLEKEAAEEKKATTGLELKPNPLNGGSDNKISRSDTFEYRVLPDLKKASKPSMGASLHMRRMIG